MQIFISFYDFFTQNQREFDIKNQKMAEFVRLSFSSRQCVHI